MTYEEFVNSKIKDSKDILRSLDSDKANLIHIALLIADESGELVSAIKKHVIYGQELDKENIVEELGDISFALAMIRNQLGISNEEVIETNINKLNKRYFEGYTDKEAKQRKDKEV